MTEHTEQAQHAESSLHVPALPSDVVFSVGPVHITNSVTASLVVSLILIVFALFVGRYKNGLIPNRLQAGFEMLVEFMMEILEQAYGSRERARKYFGFFMTIFIFLAVMNQFAILPIVNNFMVHTLNGDIHLFRISTSDWSMTLAFGLMTVIASHAIALTINPIGHIGNYIRLKDFFHIKSLSDLMMAFINFFIGLIEIIGELARPISLSARLFGNIYAGELMIVVIAGIVSPITNYFFPMPFYALGIFVGLIQAYVFTLLSMFFMAITIDSASHSH